MTNRCPRCRRTIAEADTNVKNDIARCRACGINWSFALIADDIPNQAPPPGAWLIDTGRELRIGAIIRTPQAVGAIGGIALFVSSIVAVVSWQVLITEGWGIVKLTPFFLFALLLWWGVLYTFLGKYEIVVAGRTAELRCFNGFCSTKRAFDPRSVRSVRRGDNASSTWGIRVSADTIFHFGTSLPTDRRDFVLAALATRLVTQHPKGDISRGLGNWTPSLTGGSRVAQ